MIGQLFTQDFLLRGIRETPAWKALDDSAVAAFVAQLRAVFRPYSANSVLNEAITEDEIILKVLGLLDWQNLYLRQATTSGARREEVPDLLLFPEANAKQLALKEKRDDRRRLLGPSYFICSRSLFPAAPVAGPASVMGEGDHSKLVGPDVGCRIEAPAPFRIPK